MPKIRKSLAPIRLAVISMMILDRANDIIVKNKIHIQTQNHVKVKKRNYISVQITYVIINLLKKRAAKEIGIFLTIDFPLMEFKDFLKCKTVIYFK